MDAHIELQLQILPNIHPPTTLLSETTAAYDLSDYKPSAGQCPCWFRQSVRHG